MIKKINKIVVHPRFRKNGTNVTDRKGGMDIYAEKEGVDKKTTYNASPAHDSGFEIPESYYDEDKFTDLVGWTKAMVKSEAYLRAVARNYLYGESMPEEEEDSNDEVKNVGKSDKKEESKKRPEKKKKGKMTMDEMDENSDLENGLGGDETPFKGENKPEKSANAATKKKKSLLDDVTNMD